MSYKSRYGEIGELRRRDIEDAAKPRHKGNAAMEPEIVQAFRDEGLGDQIMICAKCGNEFIPCHCHGCPWCETKGEKNGHTRDCS